MLEIAHRLYPYTGNSAKVGRCVPVHVGSCRAELAHHTGALRYDMTRTTAGTYSSVKREDKMRLMPFRTLFYFGIQYPLELGQNLLQDKYASRCFVIIGVKVSKQAKSH